MIQNYSADEALAKLKQGNMRAVNATARNGNPQPLGENYNGLEPPYAAILCNSDGRVCPERIFDTATGEIEVIRTAGNTLTVSAIASLEFVLTRYQIELIVLMANQDSRLVKAAREGGDHGPNLNNIIAQMMPVVKIAQDKHIEDLDELAKEHVKWMADELIERSNVLEANKSSFRIVPAYYSLESGQVEFFQ